MATTKYNTRYALTWMGKRWRKKYKGKIHYFTGEGGKVASYPRALGEWQALKERIDQEEREKSVGTMEGIALAEVGHEYDLETGETTEKLVIDFAPGCQITGDREVHIDKLIANGDARLRRMDDESTPPEKTLSACVGKWLSYKQPQIDAHHYDLLRCRLAILREHFGAPRNIDTINGAELADFHTSMAQSIKDGRYSDIYVAGVLMSARGFITWCYETERLEKLPRNLGSLRVQVSSKAVKTYSLAEVKKWLKGAKGRNRLYVLLMLNCGFTQVDVATLQHDQIDWRKGTITRKRVKTERHENVPTVTYKLWKETLDLLKEFRSDDETLVLLNERGRSLRRVEIRDGKGSKTCNVSRSLNRLRNDLGIGGSIKLLRKTSANLLHDHKTYNAVHALFLGHAPRSMAERCYVKPAEAILAEGLTWLGRKYGIE